MQQTYLVASAVGPNRPGLPFDLAKVVRDAGCSVKDARMSVLAGQFSAQFVVAGQWNAVAKAETALVTLGAERHLEVRVNRTEGENQTSLVPYSVEVLTIERADVMAEVTQFFARRGIGIEDLYSSCYSAAQTRAPMFSLHLTVAVPGDAAIAALRNEFLELCDDLNLDAEFTAFK